MRTGARMSYIYVSMLCDLEDIVSVRVKRIGETMLRVEQRVK